MIDHAEIDAKAKEFEINVSDVQRDYVFGWLLFGIFTLSDLKEDIFLKGGNALRKGYFPETRYSSDLDFGIPHDIDEAVLLNEINKVCDAIQDKAGVVFQKERNKVNEKFTAQSPLPDLKVYEVKVYFKDFYSHADHITLHISMDITRFDKVLLPLQTQPLIHPYSDAADVACEIQCMKLEEIIATKLKCLLQRQHAPDLFDYVYSIRLLGTELNRDEVVHTLVQKTIFDKNPHMLKKILLNTPFDYFKKAWRVGIVCAKNVLMDVDEAIAELRVDIENIFDPFPDTGFGDFAYFGPELRVPIMHAGRTQTLLKIGYKGDERLVEPYSLKYMEKKSGEAKEYFYAYNLQGGENKPGMRSFVAERIEYIENTEEPIEELRYPIELSKAGELPENPYLFDPNKPTRAPRRTQTRQSRVRSNGMKNTFQCSYCEKKFTRSTMDSSLRPHKDKNGYPCPGRAAYYIGSRW